MPPPDRTPRKARDRQLYRKPSVTSRNRRHKIRLAPTSALEDDVVSFVHTASEAECLRLSPNPIVVQYSATEPNPEYEADEVARAALTGEDLWKAKERIPCRMGFQGRGATKRRAYINRAAGGHTMFAECWVTLNGKRIRTPKRSSILNGFYCYFMMLFTDAAQRMRLWNVDHLVTSSKEDEDGTGAAKKALETLDFGSYLAPRPRCLRTSYEGVPWVGLSKNAQVSQLRGLPDPRNFLVLPPGTELGVHFRKHNPMWAYLEQQVVLDSSKAELAYEPRTLHSSFRGYLLEEPTRYDFKIEDMFLDAEGMTLNKTLAAHAKPNSLTQQLDVPNIALSNISNVKRHVTLEFDVKANTPLAYVAFTYVDNVFFNEDSNHTATYRCCWPENLKRIRFTLGGQEILFQDGLCDLSVDDSVDRERFHQYLRDRKMYDYDNPDYFVRDSEWFSYRVAFPLDLSQYRIESPTTLGVHLQFSEPLSTPNLMAICCRVEPHKWSRRGRAQTANTPTCSLKREAKTAVFYKKEFRRIKRL